MPTYAETIKEADLLLDKVEAALQGTDSEAKSHVEEMMKDVWKLKEKAVDIKKYEDARDEIRRLSTGNTGGVSNPAKISPNDGKSFGNFGEFLSAVAVAHTKSDARLRRLNDKDEEAASNNERKDMTGQTGAGGGFLIPAEQLTQLMGAVQERSFIRQKATVIPMTRRQMSIPVLDQTATTAGQPHWFGGLKAYWTEEATQKTNSDATFRQVVLTAWKLIMYTRASDELLDDSAVSLAAFLTGQMGFAGAIQWMEEYSFLQGSGAGQPLGVLNSDALLTFNRATTATITYPDLTGIVRRFLPNGKGQWVASQSTLAMLLELAGPSGNPSYIWGSAVNGAPSSLLGYPIVFTEKAPVLGQIGDISLIDWSYYLIGDRQATSIESTKYDRWAYDETSWRAVHRVDGRPWLSLPLTYQDGSTKVSPFVALNAN